METGTEAMEAHFLTQNLGSTHRFQVDGINLKSAPHISLMAQAIYKRAVLTDLN